MKKLVLALALLFTVGLSMTSCKSEVKVDSADSAKVMEAVEQLKTEVKTETTTTVDTTKAATGVK